MPRPEEVAELVVNGSTFRDWTSVMVQHRYAEAFHIFKFTAAEKKDLPPFWTKLQFKPGDKCEIFLAGILAMSGFITQRQVAYDAERHGIELIGKSWSWIISKSSVKPANYDGYSWSAIARAELARFGGSLNVVGTLDETPFENCQTHPGEPVWSFLERLARMRGIIIGAGPPTTNSLTAIGDHDVAVEDALIEGGNIFKANCVISNEFIYAQYAAIGQVHGTDQRWGTDASEQEAQVGGSDNQPSAIVTPSEQPVTLPELQRRAEFEARWHQGTEVTAQITVQGWLRPSQADLWRIGSTAQVTSPMLMLNDPLSIQNATFSQSSESGTITTLDLVLPWFLNGHLDLSAANIPGPPGRAIPNP
jgi:prophage tail gpP-like protein